MHLSKRDRIYVKLRNENKNLYCKTCVHMNYRTMNYTLAGTYTSVIEQLQEALSQTEEIFFAMLDKMSESD